MVTGALADEDGAVRSAVATMEGFLKNLNPGAWVPGELSPCEFEVSLRYLKLEVDGEALLEWAPFNAGPPAPFWTERYPGILRGYSMFVNSER